MQTFLKKNKSQIIRFIISGLCSATISFLTYSIIYVLIFNIIISSIIGYLVGIIVSFTLSKLWVFKKGKRNIYDKSIILFTSIYILGGLEMTLIINFSNTLINNYQIAWFFGAFIAAINNYLGTKFIVFKD